MHRAFGLSPHDPTPASNHAVTPTLTTATRIFIVVLSILSIVMALVSAPREVASPLLSDIPTTPQRAKVPGYERYKFGQGWTTPNGAACNTRDLVITQQQANAEPLCPPANSPTPGLAITHHAPTDPYSTAIISTDSDYGVAIEIDHIIPLSAAWDLGAHSWDQETRVRFANDPINLVAVSRSQNQSKSDQLPSQWLPPKRSARCWYVNRMAEVAHSYQLSLPKDDLTTMKRQCLPNPFKY